MKVVPPLWFFIFLGVAYGIHYFFPSLRLGGNSYPVLGTIFLFAGIGLSQTAAALFKKEGTEILPHSPTNKKLVTRGPFRITRNPMYLGMVFVLLGIAFYMGSAPMFLAPLLQFLILHFVFIPYEEKKMANIFGADYEAYRQGTRRWV